MRQVEHAVAKREARVDEGGPGALVNEIARGKSLRLTEHPDRIAGTLKVLAVNGKFVAHDAQASLDILDGGAEPFRPMVLMRASA